MERPNRNARLRRATNSERWCWLGASHSYAVAHLCALRAVEKTITSNIEAAAADEKYLEYDGELGIYYVYLLHNIHFQMYGAFFSGQYEPAIRAAREMQATVKPEYLLSDFAFLVNYLEAFYGMKAHVLSASANGRRFWMSRCRTTRRYSA